VPMLTWSQSIAAGATFDPIDSAGWQYRYLPYPAVIEAIHQATAVGMVVGITFGSDTIQQGSPLSAGGTAGQIPSRFTREPITEKGMQGDLLRIVYRNTTAGAITVDGLVEITRVGA